MIEITVLFDGDEADMSAMLFGELTYRFGHEHIISRRILPDDDADTLTDDEAASDIDLFHRVRTAIEGSDSPSGALVAIQEMTPDFGESNAQMRFIDTVVAALQAQLPTEADPTPPHGMLRPRDLPLDLGPRPKATGGGAADKATKTRVRDLVGCPTCHAPIGHFCGSGTEGQSTYGSNHMHGARLDLVYGSQR